MTNETIKKLKNTAIALVCVISVAVSAVNYFRPHEKDSASDYIVFYETAENSGIQSRSLIPSAGSNDEIKNANTSEESEKTDVNRPETDTNEDINSSGSGKISDGKISINKATKEELMSLPGIGETKADAIIEYRKAYGGFVSIEELTEVKGKGGRSFECNTWCLLSCSARGQCCGMPPISCRPFSPSSNS